MWDLKVGYIRRFRELPVLIFDTCSVAGLQQMVLQTRLELRICGTTQEQNEHLFPLYQSQQPESAQKCVFQLREVILPKRTRETCAKGYTPKHTMAMVT
jgi:hypothetical protein